MQAKVVFQNKDRRYIAVDREEWEMFEQFMKLSHRDWKNYQANQYMAITVEDIEELIEPLPIPQPTEEQLLSILRVFAAEYNCLNDETALSEIQYAYEEVMQRKSEVSFADVGLEESE